MEFVSARDLRLNPRKVWRKLGSRSMGIVTINGQPSFLLTKVDPAELEEIILIQSRIRAELTLSKLREHAADKSLSKMAPQEIEEIIQKARRSRKK